MSTDAEEAGDATMVRERGVKIIGLTGKRGVGKTEVANALLADGYVDAHPIEGGKQMAVTFYEYLGIERTRAQRMVYADLKDEPCADLPGGVSSRYFLEHLGHFLMKLGHDWTIGAELKRQKRLGATKIVVSSVAYEENTVRAAGGTIVKVVRPRHKSPAGEKTDKAVDAIVPDMTLTNDGDVASLHRKARMLA